MKPSDFIAAVGPAAQDNMRHSGIPASFTVAEAALESGWGTSGLTLNAKNLFGVKADASWKGEVLSMPTKEYINGDWGTYDAKWRKYEDWNEAIDDHAAFLTENSRYKDAFAIPHIGIDDTQPWGETFAEAVAKAGYATDPEYASKIITIMRAHGLAQLDLG